MIILFKILLIGYAAKAGVWGIHQIYKKYEEEIQII